METRIDQNTVELSEIIPIWAAAWAKEKGNSNVTWVEHAKNAIASQLKWKFGGYTKSQDYGLSFTISPALTPIS